MHKAHYPNIECYGPNVINKVAPATGTDANIAEFTMCCESTIQNSQ